MAARILDQRKKDQISAILSVGCSRQVAGHFVGCHTVTIFREMQRDPAFAEQVRNAETMYELRQLKNINTAADDPRYWRAAAWVLEHKFPERWAKRDAPVMSLEQVAQVLDQFVEIVLADLPEERRDAMIARLEAVRIPGPQSIGQEPSGDEPRPQAGEL